jgi:peptide/nickel transport system substrate-binding protein
MVGTFLPKERGLFFVAVGLFVLAAISRTAIAIQGKSEFIPIAGGAYREGVVGQPIYINPIISSNQPDLDITALVYSSLNQLIESYEIQDQGRTYVVILKENLFWSNGQPLASDDVIFTIRLIQDPETQSPLFTGWQGVAAERLSEIKVRFSLPAPYVFFTEHLARLPIIPEHIFRAIPVANLKLSKYNLEPVGSGPYRFESFSKRGNGFITEYRLVGNDYYPGPKPYIQHLIFKFYENEDTLLEAFRLRKTDGFGSLRPFVLDGFIPRNAAIRTISMPRTYALFFNPNVNPLLKDKKIRYALTKAIDKEKLIRSVFGNSIQATEQERLETLGQNNLELTIILPNIDFLRKTAAFIQRSWQEAGIPKVNVIELPPNELINDIVRYRKYEILLFGQILENPQDLFPFWHSSQRFHPGLNLALYENKKVDGLVEKARQEFKEDIRLAQLEEAKRLIIEDAPAIFLYTLPYTYVHSEKLRGFGKELITNPAQRFDNIAEWYVRAARVIK